MSIVQIRSSISEASAPDQRPIYEGEAATSGAKTTHPWVTAPVMPTAERCERCS